MPDSRKKIMVLDELAPKIAGLRTKGEKIVLCHGVFDLLHIGHIRHFEQARLHGDILVVTLTPDCYVNKGVHRPAFTEKLRAEALAALSIVTVVARGKRITQAIDVSQMIVKRMNEVGYEISDVRISSDSLVSKDGQKRNVSKIEIDIKNSSVS